VNLSKRKFALLDSQELLCYSLSQSKRAANSGIVSRKIVISRNLHNYTITGAAMDSNTRLVRPLRNGQITLPVGFRRALRLDEAMFLQVTLDGDELRVRAYTPDKLETGSDWLRDLYGLFHSVRHSAADSTDQFINAAIDQAIAHLRGDYASRRA
jgi:bifunctional DNA-binding transcriptional regulator/antitoxin component of YhaV-PrlF toxin-antitoxin module